MLDTQTHPATFHEEPRDARATAQALAAHLKTLDVTRAHRDEGVKELADHGRQLNRASMYLGVCGELERAIALCEEAVGVWHKLEREKAAHLAEIHLASLHDRAGRDARAMFEALYAAQTAHPESLARYYRLTLLEAHGRYLARQQDHAGALTCFARCLEQLDGREHTPLYKRIRHLHSMVKIAHLSSNQAQTKR